MWSKSLNAKIKMYIERAIFGSQSHPICTALPSTKTWATVVIRSLCWLPVLFVRFNIFKTVHRCSYFACSKCKLSHNVLTLVCSLKYLEDKYCYICIQILKSKHYLWNWIFPSTVQLCMAASILICWVFLPGMGIVITLL